MIEKEQQESQEQSRKLSLYRALVQQIVDSWAVGKPLLPSTGKPSGYYRLTKYLLEYILLHESFPKGIHPMPEGRDSNNILEPSFPIDFDTVIGDIAFPE